MSESQSPCSCSANDGDLTVVRTTEQSAGSDVSLFWSEIHSLNSLQSMTKYEHVLYNMCSLKFDKNKIKYIKKKVVKMSYQLGWKIYAFFVSLLPLYLKMKIFPPNPPHSVCIPIYRMKAFSKNDYQSWRIKWSNSQNCANILYESYPDNQNVKKYKWLVTYMQKSLGI